MNRTQWLNHLRQVDRERDEKKKLEMVDKLIDEELEEQEKILMERAGLDHDGVGLDDGLDAEDVAAAMEQRAREKWISSGKLRAAYYNAYCYLRDFQDAALDLKDDRMATYARKALYNLDHLHNNLEDKYKWD